MSQSQKISKKNSKIHPPFNYSYSTLNGLKPVILQRLSLHDFLPPSNHQFLCLCYVDICLCKLLQKSSVNSIDTILSRLRKKKSWKFIFTFFFFLMLTLVSSHTSIHFLQVSKARRKHKYNNDKKEQTNKATFVKKFKKSNKMN